MIVTAFGSILWLFQDLNQGPLHPGAGSISTNCRDLMGAGSNQRTVIHYYLGKQIRF